MSEARDSGEYRQGLDTSEVTGRGSYLVSEARDSGEYRQDVDTSEVTGRSSYPLSEARDSVLLQFSNESSDRMRADAPISAKQKKKIGLMGGTFAPIHFAHLHMAEVVKEEAGLDEVWFIPAKVPPHKEQPSIADHHRLAMLEKAIEGISYFKTSLIEFDREGPSYTIDTILYLQQQYPEAIFYFIIGADMVEYLPHWHRIDELVGLVQFIGVGRPGWQLSVDNGYNKYVHKIEMIPSHLSSTFIRERAKEGKSIRFLIPEKVYLYMKENGIQ